MPFNQMSRGEMVISFFHLGFKQIREILFTKENEWIFFGFSSKVRAIPGCGFGMKSGN